MFCADNFLKSVSKRSEQKLMLSCGNDHFYRDPEYSLDKYIQA
jgi:hypothetical protein